MPETLIRAGRKAAVALGIMTAAVVALIGLSVATAHAADKGGPKSIFEDAPIAKGSQTWTGMYIGGNVGYNVTTGKLSEGADSIDGLAARGPSGGLTVGFDYQLPGSALVLGARGGYNWGDSEFKIVDGGVTALSVTVEDGWYIDGRIGVAMGSALPYVFGGWTKVQTAASFYGTSVATPDLEGWRAGAGVEWRLNTKVATLSPTLALEYTYTDFKDVKVGSMTIDPDSHTFGARLNLRFGQ